MNYLMERGYDGCIPVVVGTTSTDRTFFLPPWETAQYTLDDIIDECILAQLREFSDAKVDKEGKIYWLLRLRKGHKDKELIPQTRSVHNILDQLRSGGYLVPDNYWMVEEHRERIKRLAN